MNSSFDFVISMLFGVLIGCLIVLFSGDTELSKGDNLVVEIVGKNKTDGIHYLTVRAFDKEECVYKIPIKKERYNISKIGEEFVIKENLEEISIAKNNDNKETNIDENLTRDYPTNESQNLVIGEVIDKVTEGSSHFLIVKKNTRENYKVSVSQNKYDKKNIGTLTSFSEISAEFLQQKP